MEKTNILFFKDFCSILVILGFNLDYSLPKQMHKLSIKVLLGKVFELEPYFFNILKQFYSFYVNS